MRWVFWISAGLVAYTYAGYPLLMAALARRFPRRWKRAAEIRTVTVLMAVHDGEALLPAKMEHLLGLDRATVRQIVVVSDGSTDSTVSMLGGIDDPRLCVVAIDEHVGKATALNRGMAIATEEIILFIDIRPRLDVAALDALLSNFADPGVGCAAGELVLLTNEAQEHTASAVSGFYWKYEQWIRNNEAAWDSPVGVYGGFYAIRRSLATPIPHGLILDDMFQPQAILRQGYRSVVDQTAVVFDAWPVTTRGEFRRKVRTLAGNFELMARAPWILSPKNRTLFQFVSHKVLRLLVPYALMMMLAAAWILAAHSNAWMFSALTQILFWLLAAASLRMRVPVLHRLASPAGALLVLNVAAVVGLYRYLFTPGELSSLWTSSPATLAAKSSLWQGGDRP